MSNDDFTRLMAYVDEYLEYRKCAASLVWKKIPPRSKGRISVGDIAGTLVKGYRRVKIMGVIHSAHRIIWAMHYGAWPKGPIDHKDRDRENNRIDNLRLASVAENSWNADVKSSSALGVKGIRKSRFGKYEARISAHGRSFFLGSFSTLEDAVQAHNDGATKLHGEYKPTPPM